MAQKTEVEAPFASANVPVCQVGTRARRGGLGALSAGVGEPDTDGDACHLAQRRSLIAKLEGERASLSAALGEAAAGVGGAIEAP